MASPLDSAWEIHRPRFAAQVWTLDMAAAVNELDASRRTIAQRGQLGLAADGGLLSESSAGVAHAQMVAGGQPMGEAAK